MGVIRTMVQLTNVVDEELCLDGKIAPEAVRTCQVEALVDTGATRATITENVARALGVAVRHRVRVKLAGGQVEDVGLSAPIRFQIQDRTTSEEAIVLGDEVLIGQTVLEKMDFLADPKNQRLIPGHADGPITRV